MLVLSRKAQEKIVVTCGDGRRIIITLIEIRGDKVRLGFEADSEIVIHRLEIQQEIDFKKTMEGLPP
jgi:carbon storage regulator